MRLFDNVLRLPLLALTMLFFAVACSKAPETRLPDRVTLLNGATNVIVFEEGGGEVPMKFGASNNWSIDNTAEWLSFSKTEGSSGVSTVRITATKNASFEERTTEFTIRVGIASKTISVRQEAMNTLYKVVAHRCGYLENGCAENSLSALKKTIAQNCYAAEVDVVWTADNDVVICHPVDGKVNGLNPATSTLAQIRAAGKLSDGSQMPSLSDFLNILADQSINPKGVKVWLDIKGNSVDEYVKVMDRSAEIAKELGACSLVEFLVPSGYSDYVGLRARLMSDYGIDAAWNSKVDTPSNYGTNGWAQMPYSTLKTSAYWPVTSSFLQKGVRVSIYYTPSSNKYDAFYSDCLPIYNSVKALFVNHPQSLINKLISAGYAK